MTRPLLVVAHEATRTGAPRVLLELLGHARGRIPAPVAVRLLAQGPLAGELSALAEVPDLDDNPAAVILNGASAAGEVLKLAAGVPAMAYVHEEGSALEVLPEQCKTALSERCDRVLCVSARAAVDLEDLGVRRSRIAILAPVVSDRSPLYEPDVVRMLAERNGAGDRPLVLGCGEAGWRKGADLFIDTARRVCASRRALFAWVGRRPRAFARLLDNDTAVMGLHDDLLWFGEVPEVSGLLEAADLLVMTSREDPQPLVPLEAAGFGTATAGFDVGGIADLARQGAAATVEYPDTVKLAAEVTALLDDRPRRERLATRAMEHRNEHHSPEVIGPRFVAEIQALLGGGGHG